MNHISAEYRGVKGWLLLLCVSLCILDPAAIFFNLIHATNLAKADFDKNPALFRLILTNGFFSIGFLVFSLYTGMSLWRLHPKAVTYAKRYFACASSYAVVSVFLPGLFGLPEADRKIVAAASVFNTFLTVSYMAAWYVYLLRSKRVAATYGR